MDGGEHGTITYVSTSICAFQWQEIFDMCLCVMLMWVIAFEVIKTKNARSFAIKNVSYKHTDVNCSYNCGRANPMSHRPNDNKNNGKVEL